MTRIRKNTGKDKDMDMDTDKDMDMDKEHGHRWSRTWNWNTFFRYQYCNIVPIAPYRLLMTHQGRILNGAVNLKHRFLMKIMTNKLSKNHTAIGIALQTKC